MPSRQHHTNQGIPIVGRMVVPISQECRELFLLLKTVTKESTSLGSRPVWTIAQTRVVKSFTSAEPSNIHPFVWKVYKADLANLAL